MAVNIAEDHQLQDQVNSTKRYAQLRHPLKLHIDPTRSIYLPQPQQLDPIPLQLPTNQRNDNHDHPNHVNPYLKAHILVIDSSNICDEHSFVVVALQGREKDVQDEDDDEGYVHC